MVRVAGCPLNQITDAADGRGFGVFVPHSAQQSPNPCCEVIQPLLLCLGAFAKDLMPRISLCSMHACKQRMKIYYYMSIPNAT